MTLRQKTLLIVTVTLLCLLIALYLSLSTIWLNDFAKIEFQQTHLNVERAIGALTNDLRELNSTASDWAAWDDTYAFIEDGTKSYIQENLQDATLANLRLNVMLFVNTAGQMVYGKGLDSQQKASTVVTNHLQHYLAANPRLLQHNQANSSHTGIVVLPEGFLLIASQPIQNNDRTVPSRGTLILGRFLDAGEVQRLSELTHLAIAIHPFQAVQLPSDFHAIKREFRDAASTSSPNPLIIIRPLSPKLIAGYTLLRDIEGQRALLLRVDMPREIYQQGKQGLRYLAGSLLTVGLVFGIVALLLLEKSVLSPLARFSAGVRRIRASGNLAERLLSVGRDELSRLGAAINQLLETLQQSQRELYQSQARYQSVVDNVQEVIFQTDADGRWTFLNPAWTEITGFSTKESLGLPFWKFIHPDDQPYHCKQFRQLIEGKIQDVRYEIRCQAQNGDYRWLEVHSRRTISHCDRSEGVAGTLNDITERKLAEARERAKAQQLEQTLRELTQTQAQLIQSEKMSSLGQLLAGIAHEINNPINFISGNIQHASQYTQELLHLIDCYQQHYPDPPSAVQAEMDMLDLEFIVDDLPNLLNSMKMGSDRICEIVQSLRNFSRVNQSDIQVVDIHEGLESTLLILRHLLRANGEQSEIQLIKKYGNLPKIECYPGQLNQVFMNLIANAIDALDEKRLATSSKDLAASPSIQICTEIKDRGKNGDRCALIRIADNGAGMTDEILRHLFEPFFTTKPMGKGTGLGLSISYRIVVETHKGQLLVNSELGQGTEFIIELPLSSNI